MTRSLGLRTWCLLGLGAFAGCRVGYDEIAIVVRGGAGSGGLGGSGASTGGVGVGGTLSGAGEAGEDATGGSSVTGGSGGASMTGGTGGVSTTGGAGGASGASTSGGAGGKGGSAGSSAGNASAGVGGAAGSASGASNGGSTSGGGAGAGVGGAGGMGGVSASAGGPGQGGFAGFSSLGDCQTATYGGRDYAFCNVDVLWTTARDNCWSIGMQLARVDDSMENAFLYDNAYDTPPRKGVWLGGSDTGMEGEWRWLDGELFWLGDDTGSAQNGLYSAWFGTGPSASSAARDCAILDLGNGMGWYDFDCLVPQPYVCEPL